VHTVIRDVHSLLERTLPRNIRIRKELQANPPTVMGDATQLQQVLLNLCINARDAMPDGGTLTIRTRNVLLNEPFCTSHPGTAAGWYLQAEVEDTGCGIPSLTMQHLFEPFFTTKAVGKGTGMGLATAYGIVHNHGGCIDVQSEEGSGSVFRVYLPLATNAKVPVKPIELPPVLGHGRILVVDDEDVVRQVSVDILRRLGYEVEECSSGDDAVQWYAARPAELRPDLIVMDLSMPGMDGIQALTALKRIDPDVRAVLSTGFGLEGRLSEATMAGFTGWIQKPFHPYELSVAVAQALAPL
jgi:two-component system cell cycle sensor histidine kinase/response regulator CckA